MGLSPFKNSSSSFDKPKKCKKQPNPDPKNYIIEEANLIGPYTVMKVKYPDCTNYEGRKILVFAAAFYDIREQKVIDPHFSDNKDYISPIARFVPTKEGWEMACGLCRALQKGALP